MQTLFLPLALAVNRIVALGIEVRRLLTNPLDKLLDLLVLQKSCDCVVVFLQLTLTERCVDLLMANFMQVHQFLATKRLWDQVVLFYTCFA